MVAISAPAATLDDLARIAEKAELIVGRIVPIMPSGFRPVRIAGRIFRALDDYAQRVGKGVALTDGISYAVAPLPSGRESFSPDASYFVGPLPTNEMRFISGAPILAVEVRSENDYGPAAELDWERKRIDYFTAGTIAVWDVDPIQEVIALYVVGATVPVIFGRGDTAHADPATPGFQVLADTLLN